MTTYCLTSRNIKRPNGKPAYFADEPGESSYLVCPAGSQTFDPNHRVMGRHKNWNWVKKILADAKQADGTGDIIFFVHGFIPLSHSFYREDKVFAQDVANTIKDDLDRREIPTRKKHPEIEGKLMLEDSGPDR